MTKERGIIFNGWSVRRILAGAKTETRRIIKNPERMNGLMVHGEAPDWCPYGSPGDLLYVRETFKRDYNPPFVYWRADWKDDGHHVRDANRTMPARLQDEPWKPSIHMPKRMARIWLEITAVYVERLQQIEEDGARNEGAESVRHFAELWDSINGDRYSWTENPLVWVIVFRRAEVPND